MPRPIILDCDPGIDDAVAIAMLAASPELDVLGITTSYGNVGLDNTTRNALRVLDWLGEKSPVFAGAPGPIIGPVVEASAYHGESGLEAPALGPPKREAESDHGVSFLIDTLKGSDAPVTVVVTGPMTNLALALRIDPTILAAIEQVVFMGGSTDFGNDSVAAEFNMLCDPFAARIVLEADVPKVMFGLNATHQVIATADRLQRLRSLPNETGSVFADMIAFFEAVYVKRYGFAGAALHDPCTIAWLLRPDLFETRPMNVAIDTNQGVSFGRTVHDIWGLSEDRSDTRVAVSADADGFFDLLTERLATLR